MCRVYLRPLVQNRTGNGWNDDQVFLLVASGMTGLSRVEASCDDDEFAASRWALFGKI